MYINLSKLGISIFIFHKTKYNKWYNFALFGIDYNYSAFEIRPFHWIFRIYHDFNNHYGLGPFHIWL